MSGGRIAAPGRALGTGYANAQGPDPQRHEPTPADKADSAKIIADNLDRYQQLVGDGVAAMATASATEDRAGWLVAKKSTDAALGQVRDAVVPALAAAVDAADPVTKQRLAGALELLDNVTALVAGATTEPALRAPALSCEGLLLSVLPPDAPVDDAQRVYENAERGVAGVFRGEMTFSDIGALKSILRDQPSHEITRRFGRMGAVRRAKLVGMLDDAKLRARARALETAQQQLAAAPPAPDGFRSRKLLVNPTASAAPADHAPVAIDPPPQYDDTRTTIVDRPPSPVGVSAPETSRADSLPDPAPTTIDKPPEYDDTRATIDDASPAAADVGPRKRKRTSHKGEPANSDGNADAAAPSQASDTTGDAHRDPFDPQAAALDAMSDDPGVNDARQLGARAAGAAALTDEELTLTVDMLRDMAGVNAVVAQGRRQTIETERAEMDSGAYGGQTFGGNSDPGGSVANADAALGDLDRAQGSIAGIVGAFETEASARGLPVTNNQPSGEAVALSALPMLAGARWPSGFAYLTPDPGDCRAFIDRLVAEHGLDAAGDFVVRLAFEQHPVATKALGLLNAQVDAMRAERADLLTRFPEMAASMTRLMLRESEERVGNSIIQYGLSRTPAWVPGQAGKKVYENVGDHFEADRTGELGLAATELVDAQREADELLTLRNEMRASLFPAPTRRDVNLTDTDPDPADVESPMAHELGRIEALADEAHGDFLAIAAELENEHPILATCKQPGGEWYDYTALGKLSNPSAEMLVQQTEQTLAKIGQASGAVDGGEINYWRQPSLVAATSVALGVAPGTARERFLRDQVNSEKPGFWETTGLPLLSFVLNFAAFIPGAGPVAAAAKASALGLDVYLAARSFEAYGAESALTGTDFDRARSISQDEPSLFWLAIDLVAGVNSAAEAARGLLKGARQTFAAAAAARRAFVQSRGAGDLAARLQRLLSAGDAAGLPKASVQRLASEALAETAEGAELADTMRAASADGEGGAAEWIRQHHPDAIPGGAASPSPGVADDVGDAARGADDVVDDLADAGRGADDVADERRLDDALDEAADSGNDVDVTPEPRKKTRKEELIEQHGVKRARLKGTSKWAPRGELARRARFRIRGRQRSKALRDWAQEIAESSAYPEAVRAAARRVLTRHRDRITRISDLLGNEAAAAWVKSTYPNAVPIHGWPPTGARSGPRDFDQVWRVPKEGGGHMYLVIEAKGGSAKLSTKIVRGPVPRVEEQGTAAYYLTTRDEMIENGSDAAIELASAATTDIKYIKVKAPYATRRGAESVGDVSVSEFDVSELEQTGSFADDAGEIP